MSLYALLSLFIHFNVQLDSSNAHPSRFTTAATTAGRSRDDKGSVTSPVRRYAFSFRFFYPFNVHIQQSIQPISPPPPPPPLNVRETIKGASCRRYVVMRSLFVFFIHSTSRKIHPTHPSLLRSASLENVANRSRVDLVRSFHNVPTYFLPRLDHMARTSPRPQLYFHSHISARLRSRDRYPIDVATMILRELSNNVHYFEGRAAYLVLL